MDETRTTEQGNSIEVAALRAFLVRLLADDLLTDEVGDLIFKHVAGRYHRSVVAASLLPIIEKILEAATGEDWQAVTDQLIAEAREVDGEV